MSSSVRHGRRLLAAAMACPAILLACDGSPTDSVRYQLTIVDGDAQVGEAGTELPQPLVVHVSEAGSPAVGVEVVWSAEEAGGVVTGGSVTDAAGRATAVRTLGAHAGTHGTVASSRGAAARFTSVAQVQGAVRMQLHPTAAGNDQVDTVHSTLQPLRVLITDHEDRPVEGVQVRWSVSIDPTSSDADGAASLVHQLGRTAGRILIHATVPGLMGSPVTFQATARPGTPVGFVILDGDGQVALTTSQLTPYLVEVRDAWANAIGGIGLTWTVAGGGSLEAAQAVTPEGSHGAGPASAIRHLGTQDGVHTTTVTTDVPGLPTVTFTAHAVTAVVLVLGFDYYCYYYGYCWGFGFSPLEVAIPAGRTVAWRWTGQPCDLVFEDDPQPPVSSPARVEGTHLRRFDDPGTYRYRCSPFSTGFDSGMVGRVVVQ